MPSDIRPPAPSRDDPSSRVHSNHHQPPGHDHATPQPGTTRSPVLPVLCTRHRLHLPRVSRAPVNAIDDARAWTEPRVVPGVGSVSRVHPRHVTQGASMMAATAILPTGTRTSLGSFRAGLRRSAVREGPLASAPQSHDPLDHPHGPRQSSCLASTRAARLRPDWVDGGRFRHGESLERQPARARISRAPRHRASDNATLR